VQGRGSRPPGSGPVTPSASCISDESDRSNGQQWWLPQVGTYVHARRVLLQADAAPCWLLPSTAACLPECHALVQCAHCCTAQHASCAFL
jgi:hypothetical protein